ncbi:FAD-binding oxidoreductase [Roseiarcus sp.]|uniref:FAD-binding oxidoreductase n=1 Tax=Roseiarcus sp. TaxID=1969460 RepID=UPI003F9B6DE1
MKVERRAVLEALARIVGAGHVLTDPRLIAGALVEPRGLYQGKALALVRPGSTVEVAEVLKLCNDAGIGVTPQGGNTGLVGGQTPDETGDEVILSTQRLRAIREIDPHADVMICEAGVTLAEAQAAALEADRLFPLSLAAEGTCTIGGNAATNAGGLTVIAYGTMRELITGVEAVLADGRIVNALSKLRKDNTGYDVKGLFVGSEGTLGVVTAASLRLFPNPRARATAFVALKSPQRALDLLSIARERLGAGVTTFELIARFAYDITLRHGLARAPLAGDHAWYVLIEASSQIAAGFEDAFSGALEAAFDEGVIEDAAIAASLDQRHEFWKLRDSIPEAQIHEGGSIKHDVSVAVGDVPAFLAEATKAVEAFEPGARVCPFGHLGDGNIHFNVSQPEGGGQAAFLARWDAMNQVVHGIVARMGGSFSAEHGVGRLKRDLLARTKDPGTLSVMRQIKAALDPNRVMNPGKVL